MTAAASLILASGSAIRAQILTAAGVAFSVVRPPLDEAGLKAGLRAEGYAPRAQADALAEAKALSVSRLRPGYILGADQMLALGDEAFDKPEDRAGAALSLRRLRGRTHQLMSAAVIARDGVVLWRCMETPRLTMRDFSDAFLEDYLDHVGPAALVSVGAYQLEGLGVQLFSKVEGDYFSILGLPLVQVLAFLRQHGIMAT